MEHRGVIVTHREILDDANDFMPAFARCGGLRRGRPVAVADATPQHVQAAHDFRGERSVDDHGCTPRPEVARVKTAPGEKARAVDLEELLVYRVEACLRILRLASFHLDPGVGFFEECGR